MWGIKRPEFGLALAQSVNRISADQILDKDIQAIGGAPALAKLTRFA